LIHKSYDIIAEMRSILLSFVLLISPQIPKNDPNGIWESETGTQYELKLNGSDLKVSLVPGTHPRFRQYEVNLKNTEEVNTYSGSGFFVAKMDTDKECRFDTTWLIVVVTQSQIIGETTGIVPEPNSCEVKEKSQIQIQLKKK
jgi:hypothetical protein